MSGTVVLSMRPLSGSHLDCHMMTKGCSTQSPKRRAPCLQGSISQSSCRRAQIRPPLIAQRERSGGGANTS